MTRSTVTRPPLECTKCLPDIIVKPGGEKEIVSCEIIVFTLPIN